MKTFLLSLFLANSLLGENSTIGPDYQDAPETKKQENVSRGSVTEFTMSSKDSKIYPGIAKGEEGTVPYERKVAVYVPKQYHKGSEAPFIVVHDGMWYRDLLPTILDNLIDQKRLPPVVAIMVHSGGGDSKGSQRGLEYDTVSGVFSDFIETEVLPLVEKKARVKLTDDPEGRATMGGSSGGAAAFTMAWFHPERYQRVLTYSGTYVDQQWPENPASPNGAWEYHEKLIPKSDKKPLRIWLQVSEHDNGAGKDESTHHNWVMANERMADGLKKKGYDYQFVFSKDAQHTDGRVTRQTLPGALEWLWEGYGKPWKKITLRLPAPSDIPRTGPDRPIPQIPIARSPPDRSFSTSRSSW